MDNKDYEKFKEKVNSFGVADRYDSAFRGDEIVSFQIYGFSNEQVKFFWRRYKRERKKYPDFYKWYRFSVNGAALHRY